MNLEEIQEQYKSGDWIVVVKSMVDNTRWVKSPHPPMGFSDTVLIHKNHEHILDAYLDGCEIYVEDTRSVIECNNFIDTYYSEHHYEAVPKSLEDCYCEATELHYDKLLESGYLPHLSETKTLGLEQGLFVIAYGVNKIVSASYDGLNLIDSKKIQFNEQLNQWTYCQYNQELKQCSQINNFKDYGFEADFEGEILKEVKVGDDSIATGRYMGWIRINNEMFMVEWWGDGICRNYHKKLGDLKEYSLTPIKKEWYECEDNFPLLVTHKESGVIRLATAKGNRLKIWFDAYSEFATMYRPATKEEVDSLYYKDK